MKYINPIDLLEIAIDYQKFLEKSGAKINEASWLAFREQYDNGFAYYDCVHSIVINMVRKANSIYDCK
jgi:hypothetical protein